MTEQPVTLPSIYKSTTLDEAAAKRQKIWEDIGMPMSPMYMEQAEMDRTYRGRFTCINREVLEEAQRAMRFVACPNCVVERNHGEITVTRFHTRVQDDVMTVFAAMARNFCFNCGHEEFWPLGRDPRVQSGQSESTISELLRQQYGSLMGRQNQAGIQQGIGIAKMGGPPIGGMMEDEHLALLRSYQKQAAAEMAKITGMKPPRNMTATEIQQRISHAMSKHPEWFP